MDLKALLANKELKPKDKTAYISEALQIGTLAIDDLIDFAATAKDADKATCIEAIEYATQKKPELLHERGFEFVAACLPHKAPRVKWEAAKVIGNTARLHPDKLTDILVPLLTNASHTGTVVRWSAAFALGEILKLNLPLNEELIPAVDAIMEKEEKNSIRKIYASALKKAK